MADLKKNRVCPSCGFKLLGGKFCPECGAELVDEVTMRPSDSYTDELVERTAARTLELFRKEIHGKPTEQTESGSGDPGAGASGEAGPGPSPEKTEPPKRTGFFGRGR